MMDLKTETIMRNCKSQCGEVKGMTKGTLLMNVSWVRGLCVLVAACCASTGYSLTDKTPAMSVEQMSDTADEIVIGNVVQGATRIVGNTIETDYQIQVHENLKASSGELNQGNSFTLTLPGGSIQNPPITQYAMGVPYMYKGEEVFLFLKKGSGKHPKTNSGNSRGITATSGAASSKLGTSFKVVGWNQGRFSVVTRADNGEKVVTRVNMEDYGVTNGSNEMQEVMRAVAHREIPTVEKNVARLQDMADDVRVKDPLEVTAADGRKVKIEHNAQKAELMKAMRQRQGLAVQKFSDFKAQVQGFVADGQ